MAKLQQQDQKNLPDVSSLGFLDLIKLKKQIDTTLAEASLVNLDDEDIILEYNIRLRTTDGVVSENNGNIRMNKLLHPRLIATAPSRFEQEFSQQIYEPINAALYDLLEEKNTTKNSIYALKQTTINNEIPGMPSGFMQ